MSLIYRSDGTASTLAYDAQGRLVSVVYTAAGTAVILGYSIVFKDWDGTVIASRTVQEGFDAVPPSSPTRDGYTFIGWDGDYTDISSDVTVTAEYETAEPADGQVGSVVRGTGYNGQETLIISMPELEDGSYVLRYEDEDGVPLTGWREIATV